MQSNKCAEAFTLISHQLSERSKAQTHRSIYRVDKDLREVNNKAYDPDIIAISPYHSEKDNLRMMEEHKLRYLHLLLKHKKDNVDTYISAMGELEQEARNCYAEPISLSSAKFIKMLVLNGCFIIELFDLIEGPNRHSMLIHRLLLFCQNLYPGGRLKYKTERSLEEIKHMLDLIHGNWIPSVEEVYVNLNEVLATREWRFIHPATELTDANVAFEHMKCDNFFKVDFDDGIMLMPPLTIEDRTECFFRNLIAYEQYFPNTTRPDFVTDYVKFLDCLINSSKDVEILSECGIIDNWLGDNEVVANMFNQLTLSVTGPGEHFVYATIFDRVNIHYKQRWNKAMAVLRRDYFNSPWSYFSFSAALAILLLTVAQTVLSALQL